MLQAQLSLPLLFDKIEHEKRPTLEKRPTSMKVKKIAINAIAWNGLFICVELLVFDAEAKEAYVFDFEEFYCELSCIDMAQPAAVKLTSDITISCCSL